MHNDQPEEVILARNPETGDYESQPFKVVVEEKVYRQVHIARIAGDETIDLNNPQDMARIAAEVGNPRRWFNHSHAKLVPVTMKPSVESRVNGYDPITAADLHVGKTHFERLEERLRDVAQHVAPHLWQEQCRTPTPPIDMPPQESSEWDAYHAWLAGKSDASFQQLPKDVQWKKYREDMGRLRYDEKKVLDTLRASWERGDFVLDVEAEEQERHYQEQQRQAFAGTLEAVAAAVNGTGFN